MIIKILLILLILASIIIESTLLPFPFVLFFSLLYITIFDDVWVLIFLFLVSLFLDALTLQHVGITALFIACSTVIIFTIEKIFSLQGFFASAVVIFASLFIYGHFVSYPFSWALSLFVGLILAGTVVFERKRFKKGESLA